MTTLADRLVAAAEKMEEETIALLRSLVRAAEADEEAIQSIVEQELVALGCVVERVVYDPTAVPMVEEFAGESNIDPHERQTIVATYKGKAGGSDLLLFAHPDNEPTDTASDWSRPPFEGIVENGRFYGWGVADDLAGLVAMISSLKLLVSEGQAISGNLVLASTPSKRHARGISDLLHRGYGADGAIYLHPAESGAGMAEVKAYSSGQLEFRIDIAGSEPDTTEPHQTGFAHLGQNAIEKAIAIIDALKAFDAERGEKVQHPLPQKAVGRSTNLMVSHIRAGQQDLLSRMPELCSVGAAMSFPPSEKIDDLKSAIKNVVASAAAQDAFLKDNPPRIVWLAGVSGAEAGEDSRLWSTVSGAIEEIAQVTPFINAMHTSSDIRNPMVQKGIPTLAFGPLCGDLTQTGRTDEWVDVADMTRFIAATALVIANWNAA